MTGDAVALWSRPIAMATARTVATIWCGMILGVAFIATPIKFAAPSIDLPTALDVGRVTFGLFGPIELGAASLLLVAAVLAAARRSVIIVAAFCLSLTVIENFGIRPVLEARMFAIFQGLPTEPSILHKLYVATQLAKVLVLLVLGILTVRAPEVGPEVAEA